MRAKDLMIIAGTALATFLLGTLVVGPPTSAVAAADALVPTERTGVLSENGVEIRLTSVRKPLRAGEAPVLRLEAVNTSEAVRETRVELRMTSREPISPMSRRVSLPSEKWRNECLVRLAPGEKKTIEMATGVPVEAGREITLMLKGDRQQVLAASYPVATPRHAAGRIPRMGVVLAVNR